MKPERIDLAHAVVAITGAGRGIGRATAELFARRGATVCLGDLDKESAADVAEAIGPKAHAFPLDVTDRQSFARFVKAAEAAAGPLDVLVNNAGIMPAGAFLEEEERISRGHHGRERDRPGQRHARGAAGNDRPRPGSRRERGFAAWQD